MLNEQVTGRHHYFAKVLTGLGLLQLYHLHYEGHTMELLGLTTPAHMYVV